MRGRSILSALARRAYRRPVDRRRRRGPARRFTSEPDADEERFRGRHSARRSSACSSIPSSCSASSTTRRTSPLAATYRVSDLELASRLSFFLWSSIPDDELLDLAARGRLREPEVLERQVRRMLADSRARRRSSSNFAGQWLELRNVRRAHVPIPIVFHEFDENLREAIRRETELFIDSQLAEDRSVVDLLTANYTFVNERLARHYGIPNVYGERFRRVTFDGARPARRAARPGQHPDGDLVSEPDLSGAARQVAARKHARRAAAAAAAGRARADGQGRERASRRRCASGWSSIAATRRAPSCHAQMDPLGFALENFDAIGPVAGDRRRTDAPIDASARAARRHQVRGSGRAAHAPAATAGQFVADGHREAAGLRARPRPRVLRPARLCGRSCATRRPTTIAGRRSCSASSRARRFR